MVLKFVTAGLISALLAGGAMYLVMDEDLIAGLRSDGQSNAATPDVPDLRRDSPSSDEDSVVDRLLGRDGTPVADDASTDNRRIGQPVEGETQPQDRGWLSDFLPDRDTVATPIPATGDLAGQRQMSDEGYATLIEQAELITIPDAQDDAIFGILMFALEQGRYDVAGSVVGSLSSPELRDTARQRIGISHAKAGRMSRAFAVLDDVEIEALADPIRLEIIRAVTTPQTPQ